MGDDAQCYSRPHRLRDLLRVNTERSQRGLVDDSGHAWRIVRRIPVVWAVIAFFLFGTSLGVVPIIGRLFAVASLTMSRSMWATTGGSELGADAETQEVPWVGANVMAAMSLQVLPAGIGHWPAFLTLVIALAMVVYRVVPRS